MRRRLRSDPCRASACAVGHRVPARRVEGSLRARPTKIEPEQRATCDQTAPRFGSTNCGRKARKKSAVFGLSTFTTTPWAKTPASARRAVASDAADGLTVEQLPDPEVDEVGGAGVLDDAEGDRRRDDERRQPDRAAATCTSVRDVRTRARPTAGRLRALRDDVTAPSAALGRCSRTAGPGSPTAPSDARPRARELRSPDMTQLHSAPCGATTSRRSAAR